jgi:glucose dehydrogenase
VIGRAAAGAGAEWRTYGADLASTHYSSLSEIDKTNFNRLELAWRFKIDNLGPRREFNYQVTPLVVHDVLYATGGTRRAVFALDARTGELLWVYSFAEGARGEAAPRQLSGRGLTYWTDGREERILYVTPGYRLIALNAKTGRPAPGFGQDGAVDLKKDDDQPIDLVTGDIGLHAAPIVVKDVIVIGAAHSGGVTPKSSRNDKGFIRGYDVRTGKRLWIFHTIPSPGEFGNDTWEKDSWAYTGNTGAWAQMSADEQLGYVYVPTEMPTNDGYGGHRPGANLFADSILALDVNTGKRIWHYQTVHHDIWDFDLPCAPILADVTVDGRPVKILAQPSKQGFIYVLDRTTGLLPNATGGANWQGGSLDPETGLLYIFSNTSLYFMGLVHDPARSDMNYIQGMAAAESNERGAAPDGGLGGPTVQGLPLVKPPWGRITAIDLNTGEIAWQIAHGETADNVRDHPALKGLTIPRTGRQGRIGTLVTKTLLIAGDGGVSTDSSGVRGAMLRAYDKATGTEVGAVYLPAPQTGTPMTYSAGGRQIVVVAVSGGAYSGELLAFRLPQGTSRD